MLNTRHERVCNIHLLPPYMTNLEITLFKLKHCHQHKKT